MTPKQKSYFYKDYQVCLYPMEQTTWDENVWSYEVLVWNTEREIVIERSFDNLAVYWCNLDTQDKLTEHINNLIDNMVEDINNENNNT